MGLFRTGRTGRCYRVWQLFSALTAHEPVEEREELKGHLSPQQLALFRRMPANDQCHAIRVMRSLLAHGHDDPLLLQAALLHDAGKSVARLGLMTRVAVVMLRVCFGHDGVRRLGQAEGRGWRKAIYVHSHHAEIGAELAERAGCPVRVVQLIGGHSLPPRDALSQALFEADETS